jgi:hypothetical protein
MCRALNIFPKEGGLLNQDSFFMELYEFALKCEDERRELDKFNTKPNEGR